MAVVLLGEHGHAQAGATKASPTADVQPTYIDELIGRAQKLLKPGSPDRDPALAARLLRQAADTGSPKAMLILADLYHRGDGVAADFDWAEHLVELAIAADGQDGSAPFALGALFEEPGPHNDLDRAASAYDRAAALGDPRAMLRLASMLIAGNAVSRDLDRARKLLQDAVAAGEVSAGNELLGESYMVEGARDPQTAAEAFRRAADDGNATAMLKLAEMLRLGEGIQADLKEAERLIKGAIAGGAASPGWERLGDLYAENPKVFDGKLVAETYRSAAAIGDRGAMLKLASLLTDGGGGVAIDQTEAIALVDAAIAIRGSADAWLMLGNLLRPDGPNQNLARAAQSYEAAADAGSTEAMMKLASMLADGVGVPADVGRAIDLVQQVVDAGDDVHAPEYLADLCLRSDENADAARAAAAYQRAADNGNLSAAVKLARLLAVGFGVPADVDRARDVLEGVVAQDSESAAAWVALADLYRQPETSFADRAKAAAAYGKAAELGDPAAMIQLAVMLRDGDSAAADLARAEELLQHAIDLGNVADGAYELGKLLLIYPAPDGNLTDARRNFELAAAAGNGEAHLAAGRLASLNYRKTSDWKQAAEHYREAARILGARETATEMMHLETQSLVSVTQQLLIDAGQSTSTDGQFGGRTRAAIEAFCSQAGIDSCETSFITTALLQELLLGAEGGQSISSSRPGNGTSS